jgi:hypothetical protein
MNKPFWPNHVKRAFNAGEDAVLQFILKDIRQKLEEDDRKIVEGDPSTEIVITGTLNRPGVKPTLSPSLTQQNENKKIHHPSRS